MAPKFNFSAGDYATPLAFDACVQQLVSNALPNVRFFRDPEPATAEDVYHYLLEVQRDAVAGQLECGPRLRHEEAGEWCDLTDLPAEVEKDFVLGVARLWLVLAGCPCDAA